MNASSYDEGLPEPRQLKRTLWNFPKQYDDRHDKIASMRFELRCWLLRQLTGPYSSYLFGNESIEQRAFLPPSKWLPVHLDSSHSHHGRPCARKLERGEPTHRCLTCGLDDTCVLCKYCFNPADHEGHNVFVKISSRDDGGICDCGDAEAWKRDVHCLADRGPQESRALPAEFSKRASRVLDTVFDYVVDVLSGASLATQTSKSEIAIWYLSKASELSESVYDVPISLDGELGYKKWCLLVWDDDKRSVTDLRSSLQLATERSEEFMQMIVARIQKSGRATIAISSSLPEMIAMRKKIKQFTTSIRSSEDLMREEMVLEIISVALDLCHCSIKDAEPTSLMKLVGHALLKDWNVGAKPRDNNLTEILARERTETLEKRGEMDSNAYYALSDLQPQTLRIPDENLGRNIGRDLGEDDPSLDSELLESDEELFGPGNMFQQRAQDLSAFLRSESTSTVTNWPIESTNARVKYMIFFDVRLYRALRQKLTDLYVAALVSNPQLKMQMAAVYADVYPLLVHQYTHIDRDPDLSVTTALSTQLFTTPSIATALMETDAFIVYLNMLHSLFAKHGRLNPKVFRNRRLGQVFHEFGYLLWRNTKKECVGSDPERIALTASFLALFQGLAPMQRQTDQHVEYENERWVYCYATMPFALQLARSVAVGIENSVATGTKNAVWAIQKVARGILHWQHALQDEISSEPVNFNISYGSSRVRSFALRRLIASKDPVSLLHPVHCFLSWLIQLSTINSAIELREALLVQQMGDCTLFEAPICTLSVLSQISVGYWVRNGYAMRVQLQCYRDATLRDLAYTRDIFLTQVALSILDPNVVLTNIIDRFGLTDWPRSTLGDEQQSFYIFDELLHCLNFLLCDRLRFQGLTGVDLKRATLVKEILQVLGFETMPYSELTKLVPESMVVDEHFDMVLAECADYTPPKGSSGVGMYSLKPDHYSEFDPHYTHFSIARTEEAEKATEAKLGATHLPPLLPLEGAWANLSSFTRCIAFAEFIYASVGTLLQSEASQAEQTLGRIIHLLLMAVKDDIAVLEKTQLPPNSTIDDTGCFRSVAEMVATPRSAGAEDSILALLIEVLKDERMTSLHSRVELLLKMMHQSDARIVVPDEKVDDSHERATAEQLRRRQKGKAMQQKVMAEFMRQQQSFLETNEMLEDDDTDEEGTENLNEDTSNGYTFPRYCVLCRMPDDDDSIFGILTHTSRLNMIRDLPTNDARWVKEAFSGSCSHDCEHPHEDRHLDQHWHDHKHDDKDYVVWGPAFPRAFTRETSVVQGCGHGVHYKCFTNFLANQRQQRILTRFSPENFSDGEFLCPLCRGLNNCFMPVLWSTNTLDTSTFLSAPDNSVKDMELAVNGKIVPERLDLIVQNTLSTLNPKFLSAIKRHDFSDTFHSNVRNVLLEQMLRIKRTSLRTKDLDKTYGLRSVYRTLAATISQVEIALRGTSYPTPFGGIIVDQLPARSTQFLRIFAKYISALTGFIMSSFIQLEKAPEITDEISISHDETLTRLVEMLFFGINVSGVSPNTIMKQAIVTEIGRILANIYRIDTSLLSYDDILIDEKLASALRYWVPDRDPRLVFKMITHHIDVTLRRYALLAYSICGKYDATDYGGLMNLPEYDRLLSYLQLPDLTTFITRMSDINTAEGLAHADMTRSRQSRVPFGFEHIEYPGIYRLVDLPDRLDSMFNVKGRKIPIDPAVCLLCGYMCCIQMNDSGFGNLGPCNEHMDECGVTQGLYLLPRRNYILLLLPKGRGTFIPAPYLDLHGEPDENMRRGRPHYLQRLRYDALTRDVWLWNGLPSLVARKLDQNQDGGGWETL